MNPIIVLGTDCDEKAGLVSGDFPDLGAAAVRYADSGLRVFPLLPGTKLPFPGQERETGKPKRGACTGCAVDHVHGHLDATDDGPTVRGWWGVHRRANIGIRVGPKWFVIDLDVRPTRAVDAVEWFDHIRPDGVLPPECPQQITGGGGRQLFFLVPVGYKIRAGAAEVAPGVDVKAPETGYVVAPPSVHPSGQKYQWVRGLELLSDLEPAEVPPWFLEHLITASRAVREDSPLDDLDGRGCRIRHSGGSSRWGRARLERNLAELADAAEGERNHILNKASFRVGQAVASGHIEQTAARDAITQVARSIGLGEAEIERTINSGWCGGLKNPAGPSEPAPGSGGHMDARQPVKERRHYVASRDCTGAGEDESSRDQWPEPVDVFSTDGIDLPPFPLDAVPQVIGEYAREIGELTGVDPAVPAMTALVVAGAAAGDRYRIQPKEYEAGWVESPRLWVGVCADSGELKTPSIRKPLSPLAKIEGELFVENERRRHKYEALHKRFEAQIRSFRTGGSGKFRNHLSVQRYHARS